MLPFLVQKIFTFYINDVLNCKCSAPGPKGWCGRNETLWVSAILSLWFEKWKYPRHEYLTFWCRWSETDRSTATLPILMWRMWEGKSHYSVAILVCRKQDNLNDGNLKILFWRKRIFQSHGGVPTGLGKVTLATQIEEYVPMRMLLFWRKYRIS